MGWLGAGGRVGAQQPEQTNPFSGIPFGATGAGLLVGDLGEVGRSADGVSHSDDLRRHRDDVMTPDARALVASQASREPHVRLGRPSGVEGHGRVGTVTSVQQLGDSGDRRGAQPYVTRSRPDGDDDVFEAGGTQHPDRSRGRLLERLEQGVGGGVAVGGEPVGVFDDDDPIPADRRPQGSLLHELAHRCDLDRQSLGRDDPDVGMGAIEGGATLTAPAAPPVGALKGCREGPGRRRTPGAGWAGEQPRVGHGRLIGHGPREGLDGRLLADEVVPDAHLGPARAASTRHRTSAWICSGARPASTTR